MGGIGCCADFGGVVASLACHPVLPFGDAEVFLRGDSFVAAVPFSLPDRRTLVDVMGAWSDSVTNDVP